MKTIPTPPTRHIAPMLRTQWQDHDTLPPELKAVRDWLLKTAPKKPTTP